MNMWMWVCGKSSPLKLPKYMMRTIVMRILVMKDSGNKTSVKSNYTICPCETSITYTFNTLSPCWSLIDIS